MISDTKDAFNKGIAMGLAKYAQLCAHKHIPIPNRFKEIKYENGSYYVKGQTGTWIEIPDKIAHNRIANYARIQYLRNGTMFIAVIEHNDQYGYDPYFIFITDNLKVEASICDWQEIDNQMPLYNKTVDGVTVRYRRTELLYTTRINPDILSDERFPSDATDEDIIRYFLQARKGG